MRFALWIAAALAVLMLQGCATPYGAKGVTGGYEEQQIDESSYRVTFTGNGKTGRDMVWNYWIYRCAELTKTKGFDLFVLVRDNNKTSAIPGTDGLRPAGFREDTDGQLMKTRGGGGGGGGGRSAPQYYYVPGGTVTTFNASAIVMMFKEPAPDEVKFALRAQTILDMLKPYVVSAGKEEAPSREAILEKALVAPSQAL